MGRWFSPPAAPPPEVSGFCSYGLCGSRYEDALPRWTLVVSYAAQTAVVLASNAGYFGGLTNPEVGKKYQTLAMPAGRAFAIWGLINLWETVAYIAFVVATPHPSAALELAAPALIVANGLQGLWALAFCREYLGVSFALIAGLAAALVVAATSLHGAKEAWLIGVPTSIHAGWVCAAALLNLNLVAVQRKWGDVSELALAFATCYGAVVPGALMAFAGDAPFALALAWALVAIGVELPRSKAAPMVDLSAREALRYTAIALAFVLVWLAATTVAYEFVFDEKLHSAQ